MSLGLTAPFGLTVALFIFWVFVGWAVLATLGVLRQALQALLLAPAVGLAMTVVPVFLTNRVGLPVSTIGVPLALALGLGSATLLAWRRPCAPPRIYGAFVGVFVLALLVTGRPLFQFGFDWVSLGNDDMANYALGAQFFLNNAYPNAPDLTTLIQGSDYSQYYWFFFIPHAVRPGSELLLAWVLSLTRLNGHQAFMPLILALHLVLISATAALVAQNRTLWRAALVTTALLAISALATYGVLAQLLAQVSGLALLAAATCVLLGAGPRKPVGDGLVLGLFGAALLVLYPEVLPFLGLAVIISSAVALARHRGTWRVLVIQGGVATVTGAVLINTYLVDVAIFMTFQITGGLRPSDSNSLIFPYFLLPSGLADLWGFQTINGLPSEPWLSISIALGGLLLICAAAAAVVLAWHGHPIAAMGTGMLLLSLRLFTQSADFGLFKLAMFVQPFLLGCIALACVRAAQRVRWAYAPVIVVACAGAFGQAAYVERSAGAYNEIPNASQGHITREFQDVLNTRQSGHIELDTINISLAKFQALYTRGMPTTFPSRDFFSYIIGRSFDPSLIVPGTLNAATNARQAVDERFLPAFFDLHDATDPRASNEFRVNTLGDAGLNTDSCDTFVGTGGTQTIFNRRQSTASANVPDFVVMPCRDVSNHLIFVHSKLGQHYYQVDQHYFGEAVATIGIFPLEPDPLLAGHTMAGVGRHLLFEVVNPSPTVRLVLDMTATLKADHDNQLPPSAAIGDRRVAFPLVGRGAARVFSPPIVPQTIDGRTYVSIDMGIDGQRFAEPREGLMGLFHTDVAFDRRSLVGFARDISAISDESYAELQPPSVVRHFPDDLLDPALEFSGVYEDGWVSESAYLNLTRPADADALVVDGMVPLVQDAAFTSEVRVLVDGVEVARQALTPGDFHIRATPAPGPGRHRVELRFAKTQTLPGSDGRPAGALLHYIGFSH